MEITAIVFDVLKLNFLLVIKYQPDSDEKSFYEYK